MKLPALIALLLLSLNGRADPQQAENLKAQPDSIWENQIIYNGRIWRNLYQRVYGDQFLFTADFLSADVSVGGRKFSNVPVKYDIYKDELLAKTDKGMIIRLNTELVDSFSFSFSQNRYDFVRVDTANDYQGYVNLIYSGASSLHVKHKKLIELLAVDRKQDRFYDVKKYYIVREGRTDQFSGKAELLRLFGDRKKEIKDFIRKNKIMVRKNDAFSFIPVVEYYDKLTTGGDQ